jgi:hypothetical protein
MVIEVIAKGFIFGDRIILKWGANQIKKTERKIVSWISGIMKNELNCVGLWNRDKTVFRF